MIEIETVTGVKNVDGVGNQCVLGAIVRCKVRPGVDLQKRIKGVKGFVFEDNRIEKNDRQQKNKCQWQEFSPLPSCFDVSTQTLLLPNFTDS